MNGTTAPQLPPALRLTGLRKHFGAVTAVDGIDLTVDRGEVVAFLGPNGAGKTSTIDMVLGLSTPTGGTVEVLGLTPHDAVSHGLVAAVMQTGGLLKDLTVAETVDLTASLFRTPRGAAEVLERAGLTRIADRRVGLCSGGEQQRLRFAHPAPAGPAPSVAGRALSVQRRCDTAVDRERQCHNAAESGGHAMDRARADGDIAEWPAYYRTYVRSAGVAPAREAAATAAMTAEFDHWMWCHPVPGARDALAALHDRGVPIGIVSNAAGQVEGELARLGICRRVERVVEPDGAEVPAVVLDPARTPEPEPVPVACVVDSHVVGVAKPDPRIFEPALAALGLPASARVAYVGDTVFYDVRAAAAAGLTPLLHDPFGFHAADPHPFGPHRTLRSLGDLPALVAAGRV